MSDKVGTSLWSTDPEKNADIDPNVNWREGQMPSTVNNSARAMMARIAEQREIDRLNRPPDNGLAETTLHVRYSSYSMIISDELIQIHPNVRIRRSFTLPYPDIEGEMSFDNHYSLATEAVFLRTPDDLLKMGTIKFSGSGSDDFTGIILIPIDVHFTNWVGTGGENKIRFYLLWRDRLRERELTTSNSLPYFGSPRSLRGRTFPLLIQGALRKALTSGSWGGRKDPLYAYVIDDRAPTVYTESLPLLDRPSENPIFGYRSMQRITETTIRLDFYSTRSTTLTGWLNAGPFPTPFSSPFSGSNNRFFDPIVHVIGGSLAFPGGAKAVQYGDGYYGAVKINREGFTAESQPLLSVIYQIAKKEENQLFRLAYPLFSSHEDDTRFREYLLSYAAGTGGDFTSITDKIFIQNSNEPQEAIDGQ